MFFLLFLQHYLVKSMEKFKFPIDTKSFFVGITNDVGGGHTATVSTNLKQGVTTKKELEFFLALKNEIAIEGNDVLINVCTSKSKSLVKIIKCLFFKEIYVNGEKLNCDKEFGIYLKEEINPDAIQYGRIKLHYPLTFSYSDYEHEIDNRDIVLAIKKQIGGYAYIVNSFELYFNSARIDIDATIIGEDEIPYSKVFVDQKGVGNKFNKLFSEQSDSYDYEIMAVKRYVSDCITPKDYTEMLSSFEETSTKIAEQYLMSKGYQNINNILSKYPYSPVDMECYLNNMKYYIIIKTTATNIDYFFLSKYEWQLINNKPKTCKVLLVKKVCSDGPTLVEFDLEKINSMSREFTGMRVFK